jgi:cobyrinic acid a,c-diamide synthase
MPRILVVAGVASGVGKTTLALGLLAAYRRRGLVVQGFKVGPDFIDPGFHELVTGRPSYTLDGWLCSREEVRATVARAASGADLLVVEGMMGCFDGVDGTREDGATAQIAKWLDAPVVLVLDVGAQSRSAAAVVLGFERFDPALRVAGVVANGVASESHARWVMEAIGAACRAVPLGTLRRDPTVALPERHLGLVTAVEGPLGAEGQRRLADLVEGGVDLDRVLEVAAPWAVAPLPPPPARPARARIGVAHDAAFQFYYPANLHALRAAGAELVYWSPIADAALPDVDGLYLGGGYPELHAAALAGNRVVLDGVRKAVAAGTPVHAECGGLMYLADSLTDLDGVVHPMAGVLPARVTMQPRRLSLGYAEVEVTADAPLGPRGTRARGHEFHWSTLDPVPARVPRVYSLTSPDGRARAEGYLIDRALMSYVHLHFGSNPTVAPNLVDACVAARR